MNPYTDLQTLIVKKHTSKKGKKLENQVDKKLISLKKGRLKNKAFDIILMENLLEIKLTLFTQRSSLNPSKLSLELFKPGLDVEKMHIFWVLWCTP